MKTVDVIIHEIAEDGLPDMEKLVGRVAYIWDGCIVSGWPVGKEFWVPSEDRHGGPVAGVTHWVEFPTPVWNLHE